MPVVQRVISERALRWSAESMRLLVPRTARTPA